MTCRGASDDVDSTSFHDGITLLTAWGNCRYHTIIVDRRNRKETAKSNIERSSLLLFIHKVIVDTSSYESKLVVSFRQLTITTQLRYFYVVVRNIFQAPERHISQCTKCARMVDELHFIYIFMIISYIICILYIYIYKIKTEKRC